MRGRVEDVEDRLEIDEVVVIGLMVVGALTWIGGAYAAFTRGDMQVFYACMVAAIFTVAALAVGAFFERTASAALVVAAAALVTWGVLAGWETGVWLLVGALVLAPTLAAAGMFAFAAHEERMIRIAKHSLPTRAAHG